MKKDTTGQILLSRGLITEAVLNRALEEQRSTGRRLGDILVDMGIVTRSQVLTVLAEQLSVDIWNPASDPPSPDVLGLLPESFARSRKVVPVAKRGRSLLIATEDPANLALLEEVRVRTGLEPVPLLSSAEAIEHALERFYTLGKIRSEVTARPGPAAQPVESRSGKESVPPAVTMVNHLLSEAVKLEASDIHIEPLENRTRVRYRVDGMLWEAMSLPAEAHAALVTRLKVMAGADVAESRLPQDGRFTFRTGGSAYNLRLSTMPVEYGEKVVLRVLGKVGAVTDLYGLNFGDDFTDKLSNLLRRPAGLILVAGPSGSGKSTTLAACLNSLNDRQKNIVTVEDPVEHVIPGVNQVQVNPRAGLTFPVVLRHVMRQDPDCIMIGEIRDPETANIAIRAALTGHMVLATVHCNDSVEALLRLKEMGCDPYLVSSTLAGVVSQRLLRRLCSHCKEPYVLDEDAGRQIARIASVAGTGSSAKPSPEEAGFSIHCVESGVRHGPAPDVTAPRWGGQSAWSPGAEREVLYRPSGCDRCSGRGYSGRKAVGEILLPHEELWSAFIAGTPPSELRRMAVKNGMRTLLEEAFDALRQGETSVEDVMRVFYPEPESLR